MLLSLCAPAGFCQYHGCLLSLNALQWPRMSTAGRPAITDTRSGCATRVWCACRARSKCSAMTASAACSRATALTAFASSPTRVRAAGFLQGPTVQFTENALVGCSYRTAAAAAAVAVHAAAVHASGSNRAYPCSPRQPRKLTSSRRITPLAHCSAALHCASPAHPSRIVACAMRPTAASIKTEQLSGYLAALH